MTQTEIHRLDYSKPPPGYEINGQWFNDGDSPDAAGVGGCLPNEYWQQWQWVLESEDHCGDWFGEGDEEAKTSGPAAALADAWTDYKAHHDPPGLTVAWEPADEHRDPDGAGDWEVTLIAATGTTTVVWWRSAPAKDAVVEIGTVSVAARAAAWAWYDRRLALSERLAFGKLPSRGHEQGVADDWGSHGPLWPGCLTWSDAQVTEVEHWLVDSTIIELPEVLGGRAPGEEDADVCDESGHVCTGCIGDGPCVALEAEIEAEDRDDEDEFMDDGLCSPMPQSEAGDPTGRDWGRQVEEHNATTLPLLDFSAPPPGYAVDCYPHEKASDPPTSFGVSLTGARPLCLFADEGEAVAAAWSDYKLSHDPPGMWCGFSRSVDDLDNCSIRVGVHACGARWELQPDINVPYDGFTVRARAWAWAWHDRRHALMVKICKVVADQRQLDRGAYQLAVSLILTDRAPFHRVLCWHNEWVDEVQAWVEKPSSTVPEALR